MKRSIEKLISALTSDLGCIIILSLLIVAMNYVCLGFAENGLAAPFSYGGGDDFWRAMDLKTLAEQNRVIGNVRLGAPYTATFYDFPGNLLIHFENACTFIITRFTKDPFTTYNLLLLLAFVLCGTSAFIVLRQLKAVRPLALAGALLYATSPYIYIRMQAHYCLGVSYFVPLSILLCVWAAQDDEGHPAPCRASKIGFCTTAAICLLIANNGLGYYPFFTCFFLCVTGLITVFRTGRIERAKAALIPIGLIVLFMLASLSPAFIYKIKEGANGIASRSIVDIEATGLKIVQLFIPTNGHHPDIVNRIVNEYNATAPLITENRDAYLGIFACAGLIAMMFLSFLPFKKERNTALTLFPQLTIWAMLFFSIGGVIALFSLVTGFKGLRAFNRVSIFIAFMSIAVLCLLLQRLMELECVQRRKLVLYGCRALTALFVLYCVWEQHPSIGQHNRQLAANKIARQKDLDFMRQIESQLQENDMVLQLPYHSFPECGPVRYMPDYSHFRGFLNSSRLRWSYGGIKGRASDAWNRRLSLLPLPDMIHAAVQSGFRGIYLDTRAYTGEELASLRTGLEEVLQQEPLANEGGWLLFYNLYPYLAEHAELAEASIFDVEGYAFPLELGRKLLLHSPATDSKYYFLTGLSNAEANFTWTDGKKLVLQARLEALRPDVPVTAHLDIDWVFNESQRVRLSVNGGAEQEQTVTDGQDLSFSFAPPADGRVRITMDFPDAISPKELWHTEDGRMLALALSSLVFTQE